MRNKKRLTLYVLLVAAIVLSACTATQAAPTSKVEVTAPTKTAAPVETEPPTTTNTPSVASTNETSIFENIEDVENQEWQYVVLGGVDYEWYPEILAEKIEQAQNVSIEIIYWHEEQGFFSSTELLKDIRESESLRAAISNAELITFYTPLVRLEPALSYLNTHCVGDDNQDCLREVLEAYKRDIEAFVSELASLINMDSTVVLAHTSWPFFMNPKGTDAYDVLNKLYKEANSYLISVCEEYGIPVAKVYETFVGADGSKNPEVDGLVKDVWGSYFPTPKGNKIIANLLYERVETSTGLNENLTKNEFAVLVGHTDVIIGVAWSPDEQQLTLVDGNGMVRILDVNSGEQLAVLDGHTDYVYRVAWSPDKRQLALLDVDGMVRILDLESGEQMAVLEGDTSWSVAWSPDGRQLATVDVDAMVHIWDAESGEQLAVPEGINDVTSVAWSPDGQKLATGGIWGNTACIWDAKSGEKLAALEESMIVVWSPDGQKLATFDNKTVRIWDAGSGEQLATLEGHSDDVSSVAWSPDGQMLASGSADGALHIWDTESGEQLALLEGHTSWVMSVAWSMYGQKLASGSFDGTVRIWEIHGEFGAEPADVPRELAAADVKRTAAAFEALADNTEAYETGDVEAILANYTDDIVHNDSTFFVHLVGIDSVSSMVSSFIKQFAKMQSQYTKMYINSEDGFAVVEMWNFHVGAHLFTQEDPMVEVDLLETRDGRISYWTLFYDLDTLDAIKGGASTERLDEVSSLLSSYGEAWSSGNPQMVGGLYADDAVREDTIFQERQEGPEAIMSFAASFFTWYPDAQWNLLLPFGEGHGTEPRTGGVYAINVSDPDGHTCEVHIAVLLNTSEDQIVQETLYYDPDSLISCGWAR